MHETPADNDDWLVIFDWLDQVHVNVAPSVFAMLGMTAIDQDNADALKKLYSYANFTLPPDALETALRKGAENTADYIYSAVFARDTLAAKKDLNKIFIRFTEKQDSAGMEYALRLGADINAFDYAAWFHVGHFGDRPTKATLLKWYARMEDINPQDPFCSIAQEISLAIKRAYKKEDGIVTDARDKKSFAKRLAEYEKAPQAFSSGILTEERDAFGNSPLDILGARRQLGMLFNSTIWDHNIDDMMDVWAKVPPVYKRMFDIEDPLRTKNAVRLNRAVPARKWRI